jgi:uncharacterized protein involved in exopolysaccharide biosynthesis
MQSPPDMRTASSSVSQFEQPVQAQSGIELSNIISILIDNYKLILAVTLASIGVGVALALMSAPQYAASAMVQFDPGANETLSPGKDGGRVSAFRSNQEQIATQIGLLYSESLARRVAQDLNLATVPEIGGGAGTLAQRTDTAAAIVRSMVSAEPVPGSLLIRVSAQAGDPAMAARVANGFVKAHIATSIERKYGASAYARQFLSDQIARSKQSLEESERALNAYAIDAGIFRQSGIAGSPGGSLQQANLEKLNGALKQAEIDRLAAQQRYLQFEVASSSEGSATIGPLVQQRASLEAEYNEKAQLFKPDYPSMVELKAKIDRLDRENRYRKQAPERQQALRALWRIQGGGPIRGGAAAACRRSQG